MKSPGDPRDRGKLQTFHRNNELAEMNEAAGLAPDCRETG
jgi:hypothetical protein